MQKSLFLQKLGDCMTESRRQKRPVNGAAGIDGIKVLIFFISLVIISAGLFVFVESYPGRESSPEYQQAAASSGFPELSSPTTRL